MSLWDKWEREKLEKAGIKTERPGDVEIRDTHPRGNLARQAAIIGGAALACALAVYLALALTGSDKWSDLPLIGFFAERAEQRAAQQTPAE